MYVWVSTKGLFFSSLIILVQKAIAIGSLLSLRAEGRQWLSCSVLQTDVDHELQSHLGVEWGLVKHRIPAPQWTQGTEFCEWDLKMHDLSKLARWHVGIHSR